MEYVDSVSNLFDLFEFYIRKVIGFFTDNGFNQLLVYLFNCIPEDIQFILLLFVLFIVLVGIVRLLKE